MLYKYRAKKGPQETIEGNIEAQSEREAVEKLSSQGYVPLFVKDACGDDAKTALSVKRNTRIKSRQVTIFSRQLSSLIKSGVPILRSINIISEQADDRNLKEAMSFIHNAVKEGSSFSSALQQYPNVFSSLYIAIIKSGEDSGALPDALLRLADYRAKQEEMLSRLRMALAYPTLMALVGVATVIFMLTFVMPRLMGMFSSMGGSLPLPTKILIAVSGGLRHWWFGILVFVLVAAAILRRQLKTPVGRLSYSIFQLHLPVLGEFIQKAELARFSRTLELLIKNGIPILKALDISIPVLENEILKNQLRASSKQLEQGGSLGRSLKNSRAFPIFLTNLLIVGEETGKLYEALAEIASSYERDTDEMMKVMANLLEPLMILVMGLVVGFIVVAMLLPIFQINIMAN